MKILFILLIGLMTFTVQASSLKKEKIIIGSKTYLVTSCDSILRAESSLYYKKYKTTIFGNELNGFDISSKYIEEYKFNRNSPGEKSQSNLNKISDINEDDYRQSQELENSFGLNALRGWFQEKLGLFIEDSEPENNFIELACIKTTVGELVMMSPKEIEERKLHSKPTKSGVVAQ